MKFAFSGTSSAKRVRLGPPVRRAQRARKGRLVQSVHLARPGRRVRKGPMGLQVPSVSLAQTESPEHGVHPVLPELQARTVRRDLQVLQVL